MSNHNPAHRPPDHTASPGALVIPLDTLNRTLLPLVGGKAAQLGELIRAGFAVPTGFCVTTTAYARVAVSAELETLLGALSTIPPTDTAPGRTRGSRAHRHPACSGSTRHHLSYYEAYQALGQGETVPVAVRSSATAEDLPDASFAGQQETFLNTIGVEAVLDAVRRCWAALWTDRAVSYRAQHGIDPHTVRLAVVVQWMVDAQVAGVLFTANPLTGKRRQAVIDASPGLGEAVVSGATTPDHLVVNTTSGEIVERRVGDKHLVIRPRAGGGTERIAQPVQRTTACLSDTQVRVLAALGAQVEAYFGVPQDIEWALDAVDHVWLLQARPITTLFPLPADAPATDDVVRVYLCFTVQQGTYQPFTAVGISAIRLLASAISTVFGFPPPEPLHGPQFVIEAASRVFLDVTSALRSSFGRTVLTNMLAQAEDHAVTLFQQLASDPRLSLVTTRRLPLVLAIGRVFARTGLPWYLLQTLLRPATARRRLLRLIERLRFFLSLPEVRAALDGADMRRSVGERHAEYDRERARRHVPLVLLSDGTEPAIESPPASSGDNVLRGTAASPGQVTAPARVVLDPHDAHLVHGDILVAPSTDPGWTPLFLTAGGLVMEMGGAMSHGAIVAREYGIPAVVGVAGAIERIRSGQLVTVDGTRGIVTVAQAQDATKSADSAPTQT